MKIQPDAFDGDVSNQMLCFGPFRVDHPSTQTLWKSNRLVALGPGLFVSEGVLKTCLSQIRQALGETAREPVSITTVHRRGYRCVADVRTLVINLGDSSELKPPELS